jgi:hypothetical protein
MRQQDPDPRLSAGAADFVRLTPVTPGRGNLIDRTQELIQDLAQQPLGNPTAG